MSGTDEQEESGPEPAQSAEPEQVHDASSDADHSEQPTSSHTVELRRGAVALADGLLVGALVVLLVRSFLPPRPLALPTGASALGVVLLGWLTVGAGMALSLRGSLVAHGPRWPIDLLIASGTVAVCAPVLLPVAGVALSGVALFAGLAGLVALTAAPLLAVADRELVARRGIATCIDGLLALVLWYLLLYELLPAVGTPTPSGASWGAVLGSLLLLALCSAIVRIPFEAFDGRSPGKRLMGLRVVDETGAVPSVPAAVLRNLLRPVDSAPLGYVLGLSLIAANDSGRRLGDCFAETRVERVR